jgi:hypothetical protein
MIRRSVTKRPIPPDVTLGSFHAGITQRGLYLVQSRAAILGEFGESVAQVMGGEVAIPQRDRIPSHQVQYGLYAQSLLS